MLFKELSLKNDLKDPLSESIYTKVNLEEHRMQYIFLQSITYKTVFINNPWSILIFKIDPDGDETYWGMDNIIAKTFFMRLNDIGIIANLSDNGSLEDFFIENTKLSQLLLEELIPIQFAEICASFYYKSALFNRNPLYTYVFGMESKDLTIISKPVIGIAFDDWEPKEYALILTEFWKSRGFEFSDVYAGNNLVRTYLWNEDGSFRKLKD